MEFRPDRRLWLSCALYLLALLLKLPGIDSLDIRPDETKWMQRSSRIITNWELQPLSLTTHLGHPGVPPALLMAAGQLAAREWNQHVVMHNSALSPIDRLLASRLAIVFFASLITPLIYLTSCALLGEQVALLAALLFTLDPRFLGYSRLAHLDAVLTVFVFACISAYTWSEVKNSHLLKLLAGAFWGLAVCTKPTAATLPIALLLYRCYRFFILAPKANRKWVELVTLGDVGAILVGNLTFATLYTRLWFHNSDYRIRLGIVSPFADYIYSIGSILHQHYALMAALIVLALFTVYLVEKRRDKSQSGQGNLGALEWATCLALVLAGLTAFPQVYENIIRFWIWTCNLSHVTHLAYGHSWRAEPSGYLIFLLTRLPELALVGLALGFYYISRSALRGEPKTQLITLSLHLFGAFFWIFILNTSSKQTWRYICPVLPSMYVIVAFGWIKLGEALTRLPLPASRLLQIRFGIPLLCVAQGLAVISYFPAFDLYLNFFSDRIEAKATVPHGAPLVGQRTLLNFLMQKAQARNETIYVATVGDTDIWYHQERRMFGTEGRRLQFGLFPLESTDYVLTTPDLNDELIKKELDLVKHSQPVLNLDFKGKQLAQLFELPYQEFQEMLSFQAARSRHHTGRAAKNREGQTTIYALAGRDQPASVLFHEGFRVKPGRYVFATDLRISRRHQGEILKEEKVVRLELGSCARDIFASELKEDDFRKLQISCETQTPAKLSTSIYWYGKISVEVSSYQFYQSDLPI